MANDKQNRDLRKEFGIYRIFAGLGGSAKYSLPGLEAMFGHLVVWLFGNLASGSKFTTHSGYSKTAP